MRWSVVHPGEFDARFDAQFAPGPIREPSGFHETGTNRADLGIRNFATPLRNVLIYRDFMPEEGLEPPTRGL